MDNHTSSATINKIHFKVKNPVLSGFLLKAIHKLGYQQPTPIQRKVIPLALQAKDLVAMARTGSGKTAAFLIPTIEKLQRHASSILGPRMLCLAPTHELAHQIARCTKQLARFTDLQVIVLTGGRSIERQFADLTNGSPDIAIGTPGRICHHVLEKSLRLTRTSILVIDEADRLFEMGFAPTLDKILDSAVCKTRQIVLCSATIPKLLDDFASARLNSPTLLRLDADSKVPPGLASQFFLVTERQKHGALIFLLEKIIPTDSQVLVFVATRYHCELLAELLSKVSGIHSRRLFGAMDEDARREAVDMFRKRRCQVLVATDVAARGVDLPLLDYVVHFHIPAEPKLLLHRSGRVARAGREGTVYALVSPSERPYMLDGLLYLGKPLQ
eukprot:jgi/Bigna1/34700/e_gw1.6.195.1